MAPGNSIGTTSVHPGYFQFPGATLAIVPTLTGDYHASGGVDAAEYVLWRNTLGQTGISLAADSNFDRHVNDVDYTAWRSNFGTVTPGSGAGAAVPEPATLILFLVGMAAMLGRRHAVA